MSGPYGINANQHDQLGIRREERVALRAQVNVDMERRTVIRVIPVIERECYFNSLYSTNEPSGVAENF